MMLTKPNAKLLQEFAIIGILFFLILLTILYGEQYLRMVLTSYQP